MYHHQGHNNMLSSKAALPPARHLLLQQGGSIPDESGLVLSTDAKPRLKWTPELHDRFIEAVNQLGGADKATPKTIMRLMGIPGLTLYHLKSHLQKCRLSKAQAHTGGSKSGKSSIQICNQTVPIRECKLRHNVEAERPSVSTTSSTTDIIRQPNMPIQINEALQMQIEVQRQLQEQLEVQRHLQLRIEAQGKYLQSVLEKAQEALGKQNQLSNECLGNAVPGLEDLPSSNSSLQVDSCLASSEGSQKERRQSNSFQGLLHFRKPFSSSSILGDTKRTSSLAHGFANPQEGGGGVAAAEADTEKLDLNVDEDDDGGAIECKFDLNGFSGS